MNAENYRAYVNILLGHTHAPYGTRVAALWTGRAPERNEMEKQQNVVTSCDVVKYYALLTCKIGQLDVDCVFTFPSLQLSQLLAYEMIGKRSEE